MRWRLRSRCLRRHSMRAVEAGITGIEIGGSIDVVGHMGGIEGIGITKEEDAIDESLVVRTLYYSHQSRIAI